MTKLEKAARQAFETWWEREGQEFLYALNTTTDDDIKLVAEVAWKNGAYCAEQAEQEPVSWIYEDELPKGYPYDEMFSRSKIIEGVRMFPEVQTEQSTVKDSLTAQEPVCVVEITYGREPECYVTGNIDDFPEGVFKLYAAPVRTKDLTDDEIRDALDGCEYDEDTPFEITEARAVIAADREKNK